MDERYLLKLYVAGVTLRSLKLVDRLKGLLEKTLKEGQYSLEVIDLLGNPPPIFHEDERVLATPTLVRLLPQPIRRIVGNLFNGKNDKKILKVLDLAQKPGA